MLRKVNIEQVTDITVMCGIGGKVIFCQTYSMTMMIHSLTGTTMDIANTIANIPGFGGPEVAGWLTNKDVSLVKYQHVVEPLLGQI